MPDAAAVKVAVAGAVTCWSWGWVVKAGAVAELSTVRMAALLVAYPIELVAVQEYWYPLMAMVVAGVV